MTNSPGELRINDDGNYEVLSVLDPEIWYNCWVLVDNLDDQSQVWLHSRGTQPASSEDQLDSEGQTIFGFRNGTTRDLINFYIETGGGNSPIDGRFISMISTWKTPTAPA